LNPCTSHVEVLSCFGVQEIIGQDLKTTEKKRFKFLVPRLLGISPVGTLAGNRDYGKELDLNANASILVKRPNIMFFMF